MDERRNPFVALDVMVAFSDTEYALREHFGPAGPLAWHYLIAAAKRAPIQGEITFVSDDGFWAELGSHPDDRLDTDAFIRLLGRMKQTSRTCSRQGVTHLKLTNFDTWQRLPRRHSDAARKRSKRQGSSETDSADISADNTADVSADDLSPERRGEETSTTSPSGPTLNDDTATADSTEGSAAVSSGGNGRVPTDDVPAYPTAEHHKHYRPDKAEQYARNVGAALTKAELAKDLRQEFDGIPDNAVKELLVHAKQRNPEPNLG